MSFPNGILFKGQTQYWADQVQKQDLGTRGYTLDGRAYRYVKLAPTNNSTYGYTRDMGRGLFSYNVPFALTVTVGGIGDKEVTGTISSVSADEFKNGFLGSFTAGYRSLMSGITGNTGGTTITVQLERKLEVSIVGETTYLVAGAHNKVINWDNVRGAGNLFEFIPGVCIATKDKDGTDIAEGNYTWLQTWGTCLCLVANAWEGANTLEKMVRFDGVGAVQTIPNGASYDDYAHSQMAGYAYPSTAAVPGTTASGSNLVRTSNFVYLMITP